jgi:hypothetical protein
MLAKGFSILKVLGLEWSVLGFFPSGIPPEDKRRGGRRREEEEEEEEDEVQKGGSVGS